ncbi:putative E3 ubiquitin-protein ligase RGLG2-like protein [Tanacetum coccineum]
MGASAADMSSKSNELCRVAENGLREVGIDYRFSNHANNNASNLDSNDDEVYTLVGALECIIKQKIRV